MVAHLLNPLVLLHVVPTMSLCPPIISHPLPAFIFAWIAADLAFYTLHASHHWRDSKMNNIHKKHHNTRVINFLDAGSNWHKLDWYLGSATFMGSFLVCCPAQHRYALPNLALAVVYRRATIVGQLAGTPTGLSCYRPFLLVVSSSVYGVVGACGHSNIDTRIPLCDAIFATPKVHHIHHMGGRQPPPLPAATSWSTHAWPTAHCRPCAGAISA